MDKFIQKFLACSNMQFSDNIISLFPIIMEDYNGEMRSFLLLRFSNNGLPNYLVIGMLKEDLVIDKDSFIKWLELLKEILTFNKTNANFSYQEMVNLLKNSRYFNGILYSQEGFDLINGKQHYTLGGLISRTILIPCQVLSDASIEFGNGIIFNRDNQFLNGTPFKEYQDYEENYFLNISEYRLMSYYDILTYVKDNANRLVKKANLSSTMINDLGYLAQMLDFYIANYIHQTQDMDEITRH